MYLILIGRIELFSDVSFQGRMESDNEIHIGTVLDSCGDWHFIKGLFCGKQIVLYWCFNAHSTPWPRIVLLLILGKI